MDISKIGAITEFDILTFADGLSLGGSADLSDVTILSNLDQYGYFLLSNTGTGALRLTFVSTVPEPGTWALFSLLAIGGIAFARRRGRQYNS